MTASTKETGGTDLQGQGPNEEQSWTHSFDLLDENIAGSPDDRRPKHHDVLGVIQMLDDAGIPCCFVGEYALIYYGAGRVQNDRYLCVSDGQHDNAVALFRSHPEIMASVAPSPVQDPLMLLQIFPRFKFVGTTDFWVIIPSSYAHVSCDPSEIERSLGGLPYPNLKNYVESLLDTQNGTDLEDLIDAADLSEQWGEENIDLDRDIDVEWAKRQHMKQREVHGSEGYSSLSENARPRRLDWERLVHNKVPRMGYKHTSATHTTRWRRHGSKDPRCRQRELI